MAFLVVTSTTNSVKVQANAYNNDVGFDETTFGKDKVKRIDLAVGSTHVIVEFIQGESFSVTHDGSIGLQIDTINGDTPSNVGDLYSKLIALIA